jgi:predicted deacetylase
VLVKLVDRGDELLVDTSELLQLESKYFTIPEFAQPFRLHNYDELVRFICNQKEENNDLIFL